jgi:hypothetical protein
MELSQENVYIPANKQKRAKLRGIFHECSSFVQIKTIRKVTGAALHKYGAVFNIVAVCPRCALTRNKCEVAGGSEIGLCTKFPISLIKS